MGVFGIIKFLGAFFWPLVLVDHFGRRNLLLMGSVAGAIAMYSIAAYIAIAHPTRHVPSAISPDGLSAMAFFYIWTGFYSLSWNGGSSHI
jgi:hypothetical protein